MLDQTPRVGIVEIQALKVLCNHDRLRTVRREIQVVGVGHGDRSHRSRGSWIDHRERVARSVVDIQPAQIPPRCDVLVIHPRRERSDYPKRRRVDHAHGAGLAVWHVHALRNPAHCGAEHPCSNPRIHVLRLSRRSRVVRWIRGGRRSSVSRGGRRRIRVFSQPEDGSKPQAQRRDHRAKNHSGYAAPSPHQLATPKSMLFQPFRHQLPRSTHHDTPPNPTAQPDTSQCFRRRFWHSSGVAYWRGRVTVFPVGAEVVTRPARTRATSRPLEHASCAHTTAKPS